MERGKERLREPERDGWREEIIGNNCVYFSILLKAGLQGEVTNGVHLSVLLRLFFILPQIY